MAPAQQLGTNCWCHQRDARNKQLPAGVKGEVAKTQAHPCEGHASPQRAPLMDPDPTNQAQPHQELNSDPPTNFTGFKQINQDLGALGLLPPHPISKDQRAHCSRRGQGGWDKERAPTIFLQKDAALNIKVRNVNIWSDSEVSIIVFAFMTCPHPGFLWLLSQAWLPGKRAEQLPARKGSKSEIKPAPNEAMGHPEVPG